MAQSMWVEEFRNVKSCRESLSFVIYMSIKFKKRDFIKNILFTFTFRGNCNIFRD